MSTHYTYVLYDADGQCLYVGATANVKARVAEHRRRQPRGGDIARVETTTHERRGQAFGAEYELIYDLQPLHNKIKRNLHPIIAMSRQAQEQNPQT